MQLFYGYQKGELAFLNEEESKHAIRVLRKKHGDVISVMDGAGNRFDGPIIDDHQKHCTIKIEHHESNWGQIPYSFHLAIAPTKHMDRLEWVCEKAVEIGVSKITPLLCEHSERKVLKPARLERILLSATKQSLKGVVPILAPLTPFSEFIGNVDSSIEATYIGYCGAGPKEKLIQSLRNNPISSCVMIGPEGDFSPEEFKRAFQSGVKGVTLGDQRLRTETAAISAVHTAHVAHLLQSE